MQLASPQIAKPKVATDVPICPEPACACQRWAADSSHVLYSFSRDAGPPMARARAHPERDPWPGEADLAACCVSLPCRALASQVNIGNPMVGPQQAAGKPSESCFHLSRFSGTRAGGIVDVA